MFTQYYTIYILKNMSFQNKLILELYNKEKQLEENIVILKEQINSVEVKLNHYIDMLNIMNIMLVGSFFLQVCILFKLF